MASRHVDRRKMMPVVCQLTTGHSLDDERILHRMARTAQRAGFQSLVAGPDKGRPAFEGVEFIACPKYKKELSFGKRWTASLWLLIWALRQRVDVFHLHDPDLLLTGALLSVLGRRVIYDIHDDYEASFQARLAGRPILRSIVPKLWRWMEDRMVGLYSGVIVADQHLERMFWQREPVRLGNFPPWSFTRKSEGGRSDGFRVLYVGGVTAERGGMVMGEVANAVASSGVYFDIVGPCRDSAIASLLGNQSGVTLHGKVRWEELYSYYERAHVGLALYQPLPGFVTVDHSVKIVEYMAAGLPVIASDFPGLRRLIEGNGCGIVVDPNDAVAVGDAIMRLHGDENLRRRLGDRARELFEQEYNWEKHEGKLIALYEHLAGTGVA